MRCYLSVLVLSASFAQLSSVRAQSVDEEKRKLEEEKKKLDEEKKKLEEEKKKFEEEKAKRRGDKPPAPTPSQTAPASGDKLPPVDRGKGPLPDTREKAPEVDPAKATPTDKKGPAPPPTTVKSTPPGPVAEPSDFSHAGQVFLGLELFNVPYLMGARVTPPNNSSVGYVPAIMVGFGKRWQHMFQLGIGGNFYVDATEFVLGYGMRYYFLKGKLKPYFMWNGGLIFGSGSNFGIHPRAALGLEYDHTRKFGFWFDTGPGFIIAFKEDVQRFTWSFAAGGNLRF